MSLHNPEAKPLVLATEHPNVFLHELTTDDAFTYFKAVRQNLGFLREFAPELEVLCATPESASTTIERYANGRDTHMGIWADEEFAGSVNLRPRAFEAEAADIGYWLAEHHTKKGYATLAVNALTKYAANRYQTLYADVKRSNSASVRVLERTGFSPTPARYKGLRSFRLDLEW